ncbi:MAG: hypothetical protein A2516_04625 [Alphaproteobacteria bacterium RIFOXYD12_FULL_60_8]|nr:MAG: hypothetical protein A2516_04625 [Alphaproteobacteria bacterium RIFOXYD12_FULL_60_8]
MCNFHDANVSPLCQRVVQNRVAVEILIYKDGAQGWKLEAIGEGNASHAWDKLFPTDQDAFNEVMSIIEGGKIANYLQPPPRRANSR